MPEAHPIYQRVVQHLSRTGESPTSFSLRVSRDSHLVRQLSEGREPRSAILSRIQAAIDAGSGQAADECAGGASILLPISISVGDQGSLSSDEIQPGENPHPHQAVARFVITIHAQQLTQEHGTCPSPRGSEIVPQ
jgi:hypothetical protein